MRALALCRGRNVIPVIQDHFPITSISIRASPEVNWLHKTHRVELTSIWIGHFF